MAVKDTSSGDVLIVDFTLDGANNNLWFYFAREMSANLKLSDRCDVIGPIRVPNTFKANPPIVKNAYVDVGGTNVAPKVAIQVDSYPEEDNIQNFRILRSKAGTAPPLAESDFTVLDSMQLDDNGMLYDDFSDLAQIPFSAPIYYKVIALRQTLNENEEVVYSNSLPSKVSMLMIPDNSNPIAPSVTITSVVNSATNTIDNVELDWNETVYNGTYYLFKMTAFGTWQKIYTMDSNNADTELPLLLVNTDLGVSSLSKLDTDGNTIYHRFKVDVENSSGLMNLEEDILTLSHLGQSTSIPSSTGLNNMAIGSTFIIS